MRSRVVQRRLNLRMWLRMCRGRCRDAALEIHGDCRIDFCGSRRSDLFSDSAEASEARSAIAATERRAGAAGIGATDHSQSGRSAREDKTLLGFGCDRFDAGAGDGGAAAGERYGAAFEASAEHTAGGASGCGAADAATGCGTAGVLFIAGWNGDRGFFGSAGDVGAFRDCERTDGGGFHRANAGSKRAAGAAAENPDSWAGSGDAGRASRLDGRTADQMRPLKITPDYISTAEGSVLIELGKTRVICTASVDDGVPHFMKGSGKGWVTSEYGMLPRATEERTPREATKGRQSGRTLEIQRLIGRSLRAVTDQEAMGDRTVWVDCDVIEADGGTRTASITGAFMALALAFERLVAAGILKRSPLMDSVAATSVGIVDDRALLDLAYEEDSRAEVDMNVVMTGSGHFVEIQATAEGRAFTGSEMQDLLALAAAGIRRLTDEQRAILPAKFSARAR